MSEEQPSLQNLRLIDTHCHLDDPVFSDDLDQVLQDSRHAGVCGWIVVGFSPHRWKNAIRMSGTVEGMECMLGVHPGNASEWSPDTARQLEHVLATSGARAVGEIGLDFYRDNAPLDTQRRALVDQLAIARNLGLPVVFHMRNAEQEMLDVLEQEQDLPRMLFHSFDGADRLREFIVHHGAIVGVGGLATRQRSNPLREQLRALPLSSMVLETDSPYLVPARQKVRRNTPAQIWTIAEFLADLLDCSPNDVARETTSTAESFFGRLLP